MDNLDMDKLLNSKVSGARRKKILLSIVAVVLCAGLITGACFGIKAIVNTNKDGQSGQETLDNKDKQDDKTPEDSKKEDEKQDAPQSEPVKFEHTMQLIWFGDKGYSRFDAIAINVMRGKEIVNSFSLSADTGWKCTWTDEYPAKDLSLMALFPDGVTAAFSVTGENFVISATYTPVEESGDTEGEKGKSESGSGDVNSVDDSELPQTGLSQWITLFLVGLGTVMVLFGVYELRKPEHL